MKRIFIFTLMFIITNILFAQSINQFTINNEQYMIINMNSETNGYNNIQVLFNKKDAQIFIKKIIKFSTIAKKLSEKALKNRRKSYNKAIAGTIENSKIQFDYNGINNRADGYFMVPSLDIDNNGNSYLLIRGYYKGYNVIPNDINKKSVYLQECEYNYNMRISIQTIDEYTILANNILNDMISDRYLTYK